MSRTCANCAAEIPEGAEVCANCGMPLSEPAAPELETVPSKPESALVREAPLREEAPSRPAPEPPPAVPPPGRSGGGVPRWAIVAGMVVVLALIGVGAVWALSPGTEPAVAVPDVVGMDRAQAEEVLSSEGLQVQVETVEGAEEGVVVRQEPAAGGEAEEGSTVVIEVGEKPPDSSY